jgi:succinoglycan biosynthesis protein ExoA
MKSPEAFVNVDPPIVSIVVPVRNEQRSIARVVEQLLDQDYPQDCVEVLVVDGRSTDRTCEIVAKLAETYSNLRLLDNPKRWSSAGRNIGIRASRGELIVIVDGHCDLNNRRYVASMVETFAQYDADCVGRPQPLQAAEPNLLQRAISAARTSILGHHPASYIYSSNESIVPAHSVAVAYRRSVFDKVGLFDERFDACEDVELNHRVDRVGLRCVLAPRLRVFYEPRSSLPGLFRQLMRYGQGRMRLLRKHPETFSLFGFMPALFLFGCIGGSVSTLLSQWLGLAYLACMFVYLVAVSSVSLSLAYRQRQWALLPLLPAVFVTLHVGAGTGIVWELVRGLVHPNSPETIG